jgi:hypothetical protein
MTVKERITAILEGMDTSHSRVVYDIVVTRWGDQYEVGTFGTDARLSLEHAVLLIALTRKEN